MNKRIVYPNSDGLISVIIPAPDSALAIEQIASKDVPAGVPYLIVEDTEIPSDRTFRNAWEADFTNPHGFGIGAEAWFAEQAIKEAAK